MKALAKIVEHKEPLDFKRITAARNLTICMLTEHIGTLGRATNVCIRSYLNTYSIEKYQDLLNEFNSFNYNEEIFLEIIEKYISPLLNEKQSSTLILVNTNKMKETQEFLDKKYQIKNVSLIKNVVKHLCR
jgi:hypothetical protein